MFGSAYKKILEKMPVGIFVFDGKLRVKYTNDFFRRSFIGKAKGTLKSVLGCDVSSACGADEQCAYCAFLKVMKKAVETEQEQTETVHTTMARNGRTDGLSVRIRIYPVEKGKLYLGFTESSYFNEIERELITAQQMQRRLLPAAGKRVAGVSYAYTYIPCHGLSGDLPDVYELNGCAYGVLADVSGKGVSGGMLSAFVKAAYDKNEQSLGKALCGLSEKFNGLNQDEQSYITVACVKIDERKQELTYSVAGHNAPILLKNSFGINEIELPAPPISNWMPDYVYGERSMPFEKGDLLALVTDGVTEAKNSMGEQFGIERVESVLMQSSGAEDFITKLKAALSVFSGGKFTDDVTVLAFDL